MGALSCGRLSVVDQTIRKTLEHMAIDSRIKADNERRLKQGLKLTRGDSQCLLCGRWHYKQVIEKCPKCGGQCHTYPGDDMTRMARYNGPRP